MSLYRCAACGSPKVMVDTQAGGMKYNYVKGAIGDVILGPGGAVAGIESDQMQVFKCPDCGVTLTYSMPNSIKTAIDMGVNSLEARKDLFVDGFLFSWDALTWQFKNIESGLADQELENQAASTARTLSYYASTDKAGFDNAIDHVRDFWTKHGYYDKKHNGTDTKIRYSKNNPPTLPEYLDYVSARRAIVENMPTFLRPPVPQQYRGLDAYDFNSLFGAYLLDDLHRLVEEKCKNSKDAIRFGSNPKSIFTDLFDSNPFFINFIQLYNGTDIVHLHIAVAQNPASMLMARGPGSSATFFIQDIIMAFSGGFDYSNTKVAEHTLYPGSKSYYVFRPRYIVKDGKLGWLSDYFNDFRGMINGEYDTLIRRYYESHPDIKVEFEADFKTHLNDIAQKDKLKTLQAEKKTSNQEIEKIKDEIGQHYTQISSLEKKIFGKAKAQEEISRRKRSVEDLNKKKQEYEAKVKECDSFVKSYREPSDGPSYYDSILSLYSYLLDWEWIDPSTLPATEPVNVAPPITSVEEPSLAHSSQGSSANEIREFKMLLDDGIITQEEFDAKKKQLLGL